MPTINIVIQQNGDDNQTPGSRDDLILNSVVTVFNQSPSGIISYLWQFIDIPAGSSAVIDNAVASVIHFTPDIVGTYLIKLTVNGTLSGTAGAAIKTVNLHMRLPAAAEVTEFSPKGWSRAIESALQVIDDGYGNLNVGFIGSATLPLEIIGHNIDIKPSVGQIGGGSGAGSLIWANGNAKVVSPDGYSLATAFNGGAELSASDGISANSFLEVQPTQVSVNSPKTNITGDVGMSTGKAIRFETILTPNWSIGKNLNLFTRSLFDTDNSSASLDVVIANSPNQGFAIGKDSGASVFELNSDGYAYLKNSLLTDGYIDRFSAGPLNIGPNNATGGTIGKGVGFTGTLAWGNQGSAMYSQTAGHSSIIVNDTSIQSTTNTFQVIGINANSSVATITGASGQVAHMLDVNSNGNTGGNLFFINNIGDGYFAGTIQVDGYTINPSGASIGQALIYNGTAFVPVSVEHASVNISDNLIGTNATFTVPTHTAGNFRVSVFFRVIAAPTDVTIDLHYSDGGGQAQTVNMLPLTTEVIGNYTFPPILINCNTGTIDITVTCGTANQVYFSGTIEALS